MSRRGACRPPHPERRGPTARRTSRPPSDPPPASASPPPPGGSARCAATAPPSPRAAEPPSPHRRSRTAPAGPSARAAARKRSAPPAPGGTRHSRRGALRDGPAPRAPACRRRPGSTIRGTCCDRACSWSFLVIPRAGSIAEKVLELLLEHLPPAKKLVLHRPQRHLLDPRDLLVRQLAEVAQQDQLPVFPRQAVDSFLDRVPPLPVAQFAVRPALRRGEVPVAALALL